MKTTPERSIEEIVEECMRSWSLCDLQYNSEYDRVEKELTQTIQAERQKRDELIKYDLYGEARALGIPMETVKKLQDALTQPNNPN